MNVLGLRLDSVSASWLMFAEPEDHPDPVSFLDFTVDGASLGDRFDGETTSLTVHDPDFRTENLRRLAGAEIPLPTFEPRFHRTRLDRLLRRRGTPFAPHETAFADGRVGLYFCPCGDLDCGVLSTRIEMTPSTVTWHDVGWQVTYEPFNAEQPRVATFDFDRANYDGLFQWLMAGDWSKGVPVPVA